MSEIHARLVAERKRLNIDQKALAEAAGVARSAQANYEAGKRVPDAAYLAAIAPLGFDVQFVVTGRRGAEVDATLFGLCEAALAFALQAARPGLTGPLAFRVHQVCRVYNSVVNTIRPDDDLRLVAAAAADRAIQWADDPADASQLLRVLLRSSGTDDIAGRGAPAVTNTVLASGSSVVASAPGAIAAGRSVIQHAIAPGQKPKKGT